MEKAMAPHSSTPAWKIPWTEEPGGLQPMGSQRVGHDCGECARTGTRLLTLRNLSFLVTQWLMTLSVLFSCCCRRHVKLMATGQGCSTRPSVPRGHLVTSGDTSG